MKQRTFLTTLILFLFFFNLGISIVSAAMFQDTVKRAEEKSLGEHYFITSALLRDFSAVASRGIDIDTQLTSLLQPYSYLSGDNKTGLAFYKSGQLVYSNQGTTVLQKSPLQTLENDSRLATVRKWDDKTYVIISGRLPSPYEAYGLVYFSDVTEGVSAWSQLKNLLFLAGFALSFLFALGLLLVLNRIFKPLDQISRISREIAAGAYDTRLPLSGHNELSEMARSFNHMAEEIQYQMTELKEGADKKQQFVDNFAHELRTPLTAIYGYAEYLQKAALSEDDRLAALNYIMAESRRLQTIGYQLLELANLQHTQAEFEAVKITSLFEQVRQTLHSKLAGKEIGLEFSTEIEILHGDAHLLESLLVNLIDNAVTACGRGGRILVRAVREMEQTTLIIRDNGKGMTPEVLAQITEPFYRGEKSRNRKDGGAGLGLAICRQIVASHGGKLTFSSRPGEGTTVRITFTTTSPMTFTTTSPTTFTT